MTETADEIFREDYYCGGWINISVLLNLTYWKWEKQSEKYVVYHLNGETIPSTVCTSGNQNSTRVSFVWDSPLTITEKPPIYQESLGRTEPDQKIQYGAEELQMIKAHYLFGCFCWKFWNTFIDVTSVYFGNVSVRQAKIVLPFTFWSKFPDFLEQIKW